jgi:hypothetical protein
MVAIGAGANLVGLSLPQTLATARLWEKLKQNRLFQRWAAEKLGGSWIGFKRESDKNIRGDMIAVTAGHTIVTAIGLVRSARALRDKVDPTQIEKDALKALD